MFKCPQDLLTAHWQACSNPTDSSTLGLTCDLLGGPLAPTLFSFGCRLRRPSWNLLESLGISSNLLESLKRPSNSFSACGSPIGPDQAEVLRRVDWRESRETGGRERESCENREREREKRREPSSRDSHAFKRFLAANCVEGRRFGPPRKW